MIRLALLIVALTSALARAEVDLSSPWVRGPAVVGCLFLVSTLDHEARAAAQDHRDVRSDLVADHVRVLGRPRVYIPVSLGWLGLGVLGADREVLAAGVRVTGTVILTGLFTRGLKYGVGRARPSRGHGNAAFDPLSNQTSFPSGHATMAFALAAAIAQEAGHPAVTGLCYGLAGATAWSRLNDDNHWLSDTTAGAALGIATARLVRAMANRWGGSMLPTPIHTPEGTGVALRIRF